MGLVYERAPLIAPAMRTPFQLAVMRTRPPEGEPLSGNQSWALALALRMSRNLTVRWPMVGSEPKPWSSTMRTLIAALARSATSTSLESSQTGLPVRRSVGEVATT